MYPLPVFSVSAACQTLVRNLELKRGLSFFGRFEIESVGEDGKEMTLQQFIDHFKVKVTGPKKFYRIRNTA